MFCCRSICSVSFSIYTQWFSIYVYTVYMRCYSICLYTSVFHNLSMHSVSPSIRSFLVSVYMQCFAIGCGKFSLSTYYQYLINCLYAVFQYVCIKGFIIYLYSISSIYTLHFTICLYAVFQ